MFSVEFRNEFKMISVVTLSLVAMLAACTDKSLDLQVGASNKIEGNLALPAMSMSMASLACSPVVNLYSIDSTGNKSATAVMSTSADSSSGYYVFQNIRTQGVIVNTNSVLQYLLEVVACNGKAYSRPLTGLSGQNISFASDLIAQGLSVAIFYGKNITSIDRTQLETFAKNLQLLDSADLESLYSQLLASSTLSTQFTALFNMPVTSLADALPKISLPSIVSTYNETDALTGTAVATHWHPAYSSIFEWKLSTSVISTLGQVSNTFSKNDQGVKDLILRIGKDNGSGAIDSSKPVFVKTWKLTINNSYLPTPPALSVSPAITTAANITVNLDTGVGLVNCQTFSNLAITEDSLAVPSAASFNLPCTTSTTQAVAWSLNPTNGTKTLRLWAIDSAGNISIIPQSFLVTLDNSAPVVSLTSMISGNYQGGSTQGITWTASDSGVGVASNGISLQYSADNGSTWNTISLGLANSGSYAWVLPAINSNQVQVKVTAADGLANSSSAVSTSNLTIDSTAPSVSLTSLNSGNFKGGSIQNITWTASDAGVGLAANPISVDYSADNGASWSSVATGLTNSGTYAWTLPSITSSQVKVRVTAVDGVGNSQVAVSSASLLIDSAAPVLSLTSLNSGTFQGGSIQNITWTASDANAGLGATPVSIDYSSDNGTSWNVVVAANANSGTYAWTLPALDNTTVKVRVTVTDQVGNVSVAISSSAFTIDSTAPIVSSVIINGGATYAGTAALQVTVGVADNFSTGAQISIRIKEANAGTGDCQSQFANDSWAAYTNSSTNLAFVVAPVDGTKKICVWAKDSAGNVSSMSPTTGTLGVNFGNIIYHAGSIPQITAFTVTRNSGGSVVTAGDAMTVSWAATDAYGLDNNPISFSYTLNNNTWLDFGTGLDATNPANVTWYGGLSGNPVSGSSSQAWVAPASSYFWVKATVRNISGSTSLRIFSQAFNMGSWSVFAGSPDRGIGGVGRSAKMEANLYRSLFAINPLTGDFYAVDVGKGILKLSSSTGLVSTFIAYGGNNLPDSGPLPASPSLFVDSIVALTFDSKGRLYVTSAPSIYSGKIYQISLDTNSVLLYAGGGTADDGGVSSSALNIGPGSLTFDDQDSMYLWSHCGGPATAVTGYTVAKRMLKIQQNLDGTPGTVTRVIGDCTTGAPVWGSTAATQPAMNYGYVSHFGIAAWNGGNTIFVSGYGSPISYKIVNGKVYSTNIVISANASGAITYNSSDGKLYVQSTLGIDKVTVSTAGNDGDNSVNVLNSTNTSFGCNVDGALATNFCGLVGGSFSFFGGLLFFSEGLVLNGFSSYEVRYIDSTNAVRTIMGSLPFYGDGLDKAFVRGSLSGIYYKKPTELNQGAFPTSLYFVESSGVVFGRIDPASGITSVLWGSQLRQPATLASGLVTSSSVNMGSPYAGGNGMPLTFDDQGLPWMRAQHAVISLNASQQVQLRTVAAGGPRLETQGDGLNPANYSIFPYSGQEGFTLKGSTLFIRSTYKDVSIDPIMAIRALIFGSNIEKIILGGMFLNSANMSPSPDIATPGSVAIAPLDSTCINNVIFCSEVYDANSDRLYITERNKFRYITTPDNTATSTLTTVFTTTHGIFSSFTLTPNGQQIWYLANGGGLYCRDLSSGKSWCDDTTNYYAAAAAASFGWIAGPNQLTFKDNSTLFMSTYNGVILQFTLPVGP